MVPEEILLTNIFIGSGSRLGRFPSAIISFFFMITFVQTCLMKMHFKNCLIKRRTALTGLNKAKFYNKT